MQQIELDHRTELEQLLDLVERQRGDDRTPMGIEGDQPLRLELAQRFAYRDAADAELLGDGILAEWLAFRKAPVEDALAERIRRHSRERLAGDREDLRLGLPRIAACRDVARARRVGCG